MYIRQCFRTVEGKRRAYWALVESVRTERGPRQNVVAWLLDPSSELYISEQWYPKTALPDLLGVPADRIWVMDRGMTSEDNLEFLRQENRRYIIGTNKALLKKFEQELLKKDWTTIRDGIEVKLCKMPTEEDSERTDARADAYAMPSELLAQKLRWRRPLAPEPAAGTVRRFGRFP